MNVPKAEELHSIVSHGRWDRAAAVLARLDPAVAADAFLSLPHHEQQILFQHLPLDFAARLGPALPVYDAFVLLHTLPMDRMKALVEKMNPAERVDFIDELPEEAWRQIVTEIYGDDGTAARALEAPPVPTVEPIIEARDIEKRFGRAGGGEVQVIAPTSLRIEPGVIVALLGPSGSGKSTLLRMLSGLAEPSAGQVLWHGRPLDGHKANVAIVFQSFALFPWLTVLDNVEVPLLARGMEHAERRRRALKNLQAVGLGGFEDAYPKELSGGMKQRVGFARALAVEPEILFMDEAFSALDVLTAETLRGELLELWQEKKIPTKSIFLVTHNIEEAVLMADRIIVLAANPARIRADFRVCLHTRNRNSTEFILYVDYIYKLMTQPLLEAEPPAPAAEGGRQSGAGGRLPGAARIPYRMLPHARPGSIAGLLELLNDRGGKEDLYRIAEELRMDVDDLLPVVEAAALLSFARSERGDIELTPAGKSFAEADIVARKTLFREEALAHVRLLQQMHSAVRTKSDGAMPLEFFRDILDEHLSNEEVQREIETALDWGRYSGLFTYDSETDRLMRNV
jgi:NitT/TauT family transport system ATP-binding protein